MAASNGLAWLLDDMTQRVPHVRYALVLSNDGLVTGASGELDRATAEHLAAVSSGFHNLAIGAGRHFGTGEARQTTVRFEEGCLFVTSAGDGSCLSVLSGTEADLGQVEFELTRLVRRVGEHLSVAARQTGITPV
jgi:predicted regulator of Ras-like GTPase activity (Roadblock/LC7/MglB family)